MAMNIKVVWKGPVELDMQPSDHFSVHLKNPKDLGKVTKKHGVYLFAKTDRGLVTPLYIGKALNIQKRILDHFKKDVILMNKIKSSGRGRKVLFVGEIAPERGQSPHSASLLVEETLIRKAGHDNWDLLNIKGVNKPAHHIRLSGARGAAKLFGKKIMVPQKERSAGKKTTKKRGK